MVNGELCDKCCRDNFARVLQFQKRKVEKQLHEVLEVKHMYGNAYQGMDDKFLIQKVPIVIRYLCSKWHFIV